MMLYDVFYYTPDGTRQAGFDSCVHESYLDRTVGHGEYVLAINLNGDGQRLRYDPTGKEIDRFPWDHETEL